MAVVSQHIFLKGCEMDELRPDFDIHVGDKLYDGPTSRKLKPFALKIRGVCSEWRRMINSEKNFSLTRYWFARLVLVIPLYFYYSRMDDKQVSVDGSEQSLENSRKLEKVSFAKQMVRFDKQLINSRGCDLQIFLASSEKLQNWDASMDPYSETGSLLRLLTYTIVSLREYCKQIVGIEVHSDEPHVLFNTFNLLSIIPQQDSRLSRIEIRSFTSLEEVEIGMRTELGAIWSRPGKLSCISTPPDLSHLTNVDELYVSDGLLTCGGLRLPEGTSTMRLMNQRRNMSWLKILILCQPHSFSNLTSLNIMENKSSSDRDPEVLKWLSLTLTWNLPPKLPALNFLLSILEELQRPNGPISQKHRSKPLTGTWSQFKSRIRYVTGRVYTRSMCTTRGSRYGWESEVSQPLKRPLCYQRQHIYRGCWKFQNGFHRT